MKTATQADILAPRDPFPLNNVFVLSAIIEKTYPVAKLLRDSTHYTWETIKTGTFASFVNAVETENIDIVLMVFDQIDDDLCTHVDRIHAKYPTLPVVVIIQTDEAPFYNRLIDCGVQDILTTPLLSEPFLTHALLNAYSRNRIVNLLVAETNFSEALREIAMALNATHDLTDVMNRILDTIGQLIPHTAANIALVEGELCRIAYQRGYDQYALPTDAFFPSNWNAWAQMVQEQKPFLIPDTSIDPHWYAVGPLDWIKSYLGAPIISHHNVIGFINLDSDQVNFFTEQHRHRLKSFADQVAIAVSNAHTYLALEANNHEIAMLHRGYGLLMVGLSDYQTIDEMANHVTRTITETFGHADCGMLILDPEANLLRRVARNGPYGIEAFDPLPLEGKGLVPEAVKTKRVVYVPDVRQDPRYIPTEPRTLTELVIPLINQREVLGVLDLQSANLDAFSPRDMNVLEVFANRVTVMLDNVRLYEALRRDAKTLAERVEQRTRQLQQTRDQIEAIFNNSIDAIILTYLTGQIRQTNPACDTLFGYAPDALFEHTIEELFDPTVHAQLEAARHQSVASHSNQRLELVARRADGSTFFADVAISLIEETDQEWQRVLYTVRDMTAFKEAAAQTEKALAHQLAINDLKTRFIRATNHEFKTPLTAILTQAENLVNYWERIDDAVRKQKVENIYQLVLRQREQLDSVLNLQRLSNDEVSFNPQLTDIPARCQAVIDRMIFTVQCPHIITFEWTGQYSFAWIDRDVLEIVLSNLLSNAIKYSPHATPIEVRLDLQLSQMKLSVMDHGIGIPIDAQARLFQPFFRAPNAASITGTGIGLSLIKAYIENYGGAIRFESLINEGTTFVVQLPVKSEDTK